MSLVMKCDVCGKTYDPYNVGSANSRVNADISPNAVRLVSYNIGDTHGISGRRYDLCPECMKQLIDILRQKNTNV